MRKELRKICATTTAAAVLLSVTPIATPVAHAGWGSVIGGVIGGILNGGGSGGSNGGGNGGQKNSGPAHQEHARKNMTDNEKLFIVAIKNNDIAVVKSMIDAGVDINGVFSAPRVANTSHVTMGYNYTPLEVALFNKHYDMVQLLLENGADVSGYYTYEGRHRSYVEEMGHNYQNIEIIQYLLDWGADINGITEDFDGHPMNALDAIVLEQIGIDLDWRDDAVCEMITFLMEKGINPELPVADRNITTWNETPFLYAATAYNRTNLKIMRALAAGGCNIYAQNRTGKTALQLVLDLGNYENYKAVEEIYAHGQQPSQYQPSKPQHQYRTSESGGNASGDDELVTFENKSNQNTRIQELNNFNDVVIKATRAERKANEPLDRYMKDHPGVASGAEYSAILKNYVDAVKKIKDSVNPENLLGNLSHLSFDEKEICGDLLQVMNTRYDKMIEIYSRFALNRDFTPEEMDKMKVLQEEIESLGQSVIDISGRVDKLPR